MQEQTTVPERHPLPSEGAGVGPGAGVARVAFIDGKPAVVDVYQGYVTPTAPDAPWQG